MLHEATIAAVRLRQADLLAAADRDRCCGRGALLRERRARLARKLLHPRR